WWKQTYTAPETVFASPFGSAPQLGEVIGLHGTPAIRPHKQIIFGAFPRSQWATAPGISYPRPRSPIDGTPPGRQAFLSMLKHAFSECRRQSFQNPLNRSGAKAV